MPIATGFHHVGIAVQDISRSIEFLSVFGFAVELELKAGGEDFQKGIAVDEAEIKLVLLKHEESSTRVELIQFLKGRGSDNALKANDLGFAHIGLFVADIEDAVKKASAAGAKPVSKVTYNREAGLAWVYLNGPEGTTVELLQQL